MAHTIRKNRFTGESERDDYHRHAYAARACGHPTRCSWCHSNRTISTLRKERSAEEDMDLDWGDERPYDEWWCNEMDYVRDNSYEDIGDWRM